MSPLHRKTPGRLLGTDEGSPRAAFLLRVKPHCCTNLSAAKYGSRDTYVRMILCRGGFDEKEVVGGVGKTLLFLDTITFFVRHRRSEYFPQIIGNPTLLDRKKGVS